MHSIKSAISITAYIFLCCTALFFFLSCGTINAHPPDCIPDSCEKLGYECGFHENNCGYLINCGSCPDEHSCQEGTCVSDNCLPITCESMNYDCGNHSDNCGDTINCGVCPGGYSCQGGACVPDNCVPITCESMNYDCGYHPDNCGSTINCGVCPSGYSCIEGICVIDECLPLTCIDVENQCGEHNDGCGGLIDCGPCETGSLTPGTSVLTISAAGQSRSVNLWVPEEVDHSQRPLIIALHGNGDTSSNFASTSGIAHTGLQRGAIVAAPQGITQSFNYHGIDVPDVSWDAYRGIHEGNIDLPLLENLVTHLVDSGSVNTSAIYVFGYSQGGYMSFRAGLGYANTYAAAVVVSAADPMPGAGLVSGAARKIPVAITIGSNDWAVNQARNTRNELETAGHEVRYEEIPGAGHVPYPGNTPNLLDWLLQRYLP